MTGPRAYLDHAATSPLTASSAAAMSLHLGLVGNASSLHTSGRAARRVLEEAREELAAALGAHPAEVVFTSGGTEADNLAVHGAWIARRAAGPGEPEGRPRVVVSSVEHHALLWSGTGHGSTGCRSGPTESWTRRRCRTHWAGRPAAPRPSPR